MAKAAAPKGRTGKSPRGNSWSQVEAAAKKLAGRSGDWEQSDNLLSADVYVQRAKRAGKTDAEIAKMTAKQLASLSGSKK